MLGKTISFVPARFLWVVRDYEPAKKHITGKRRPYLKIQPRLLHIVVRRESLRAEWSPLPLLLHVPALVAHWSTVAG